MPRSRRVELTHRLEHRLESQPDPREKPWRHPLGWTREQVALVTYNTHVRQRDQAIEDARSAGSIVRVPPEWSTWERTLPPANAHVATTYLRLPALQLEPLPLDDALAAHRPLVTRRAPDARPVGTFVELHERWRTHDLSMRRAAAGEVEPHAMTLGSELAIGAPVAVITATTGSTRAQVRSTHVARIEALVGAEHVTVDSAREAAQHLLLTGDEAAPLAIVRGPAGVHVARVQSSSLGLGPDGEPLVGSLAASGTSLRWRASTTSLVAVLGLDGIRWMD